MRSTNDDQSSNRRPKPSLMPSMHKSEQLICPSIESQKHGRFTQFTLRNQLKWRCTHKNRVYLSLTGVYPMLTRIGLVASWGNTVWAIHFSLCEALPGEDYSGVSECVFAYG